MMETTKEIGGWQRNMEKRNIVLTASFLLIMSEFLTVSVPGPAYAAEGWTKDGRAW